MTLSWSCVETDAIAKGKVLGGCALVELVTGAEATTARIAAAASGPDPGRVALEDFRVRIAGGGRFHTGSRDIQAGVWAGREPGSTPVGLTIDATDAGIVVSRRVVSRDNAGPIYRHGVARRIWFWLCRRRRVEPVA